jgi:hypothetical protein
MQQGSTAKGCPLPLDLFYSRDCTAGIILFSLDVRLLAQTSNNEPSEESIKRTLDMLHEKAKSSTAVTVTECDAVRPMMEVGVNLPIVVLQGIGLALSVFVVLKRSWIKP